MISPSTLSLLRSRADVVREASLCTELRRSGSGLVGRCPFHEEKTGSFYVSPARGTWHCFGACGEGGDVIRLVMKRDCLTFPEAVRKLCAEYGVPVDEAAEEEPEARAARLRREALLLLNGRVAEFYRAALHGEGPAARAALAYAEGRWGADYVTDAALGYAPDRWDALARWARERGESVEDLTELGLLRRNEEKGRVYDFYRGRLVIPVRDTAGRVTGFTCRDLTGKDGAPKYLNSSESAAYDKGRTLFGMDIAARAAAKAGQMIIVEGAADAMRMHASGVANVCAPCGGALTAGQLEAVGKVCRAVCLIPDGDPAPDGKPYGAGVAHALRNGAEALAAGFFVTVRELPDPGTGAKTDPGDYFTTPESLAALREEDFVLWAGRKEVRTDTPAGELPAAIRRVAALAAGVRDDMRVELLLDGLKKLRGTKEFWRAAINKARWDREKDEKRKGGEIDLRQYGFVKEGGCYVGQSDRGGETVWSNFEMTPVFHVKDAESPKRIFHIRNNRGAGDIVEIGMEDLCSLSKFRQKIEGLGNYTWMAGERELMRLKSYLYENTETAVQVRQMGWNAAGFYAFGNGVWEDGGGGRFVKADDFGVCRMGGGVNWYIPAASKLYREDRKKYERERNFVHAPARSVDMRAYLHDFVAVYGNNGVVALAYWLCSLFRDVVADATRSFPLLNLFGPKGSGKTELGAALMAFFRPDNKAPNLRNSTATALNDDVAFASDALVHLDEYKNDIRPDKIEFLKGLYDGVGRVKMGGEGFQDRIMTAVKSGVVVSGQEMPTADPALFSRCLFLQFSRAEFTTEERRRFAELRETQRYGLSPLVLKVLEQRKYFAANWESAYAAALADLDRATGYRSLESRIMENWAKPLAAASVLFGALPLPFTREELLRLSAKGAVKQCEIIQTGNELAHFWGAVAYLQAQGEIFEGADYRIEVRQSLPSQGAAAAAHEWERPRRVMFLNKSRVFALYQQAALRTGKAALPEDSLKIYLENAEYYLGNGYKTRFKQVVKGVRVTYTDPAGRVRDKEQVLRAMCFDYDALAEKYGIDLGNPATDGGDELPF